MKEKIYFLINSLEGGGAERVITTVSEEMQKEKDITIITLKNKVFFDLPQGIKHIPLSNIKNNIVMTLGIAYFVYKFKKILKREKFNGGMSSLEIANFVNILANKDAKVAFETSMYFFSGITGFFYKTLIKRLYPKAKAIKVNSEENKEHLAKYLKISKDKIFVIHNPINIKKIEENKKEDIGDNLKNKIKGKKIFITSGRLIQSKHHDKIILALNNVYKSLDKNRILLILSDGPERTKLVKMVNEIGLQRNILFLGLQKNVFKFMNIANYYLYASKVEGFPNVIIEAMACNLPIISSNFKTGGMESILGEYKNTSLDYPYYGENGVLININNYENDFYKVYKNINKLKQNKKGFEKFEIGNIAKQHLEFINS